MLKFQEKKISECVCVRECVCVCVCACVDGVEKENREKGFPPMSHFSHFTPLHIVCADDRVNGGMILLLLLQTFLEELPLLRTAE